MAIYETGSRTFSIWQPEHTCTHAIICLRLKVANNIKQRPKILFSHNERDVGITRLWDVMYCIASQILVTLPNKHLDISNFRPAYITDDKNHLIGLIRA